MADRTTFFIIDRAVFQNEAINGKPFDDFHAWIYLIGKANFADRIVRHRGQIQKVKRGEMLTSFGFLASEWGWSYNKTRRYIRQLERLSMLQVESTPLGITLTIENYAKFQNVRQGRERTDERADERPNERADERQKNKGNKENNVCDAHTDFSEPPLDEIRSYCEGRRNGIDPQSFADYYTNKGWPKDWRAAIRRWESYDRKRTEAEQPTRDGADQAWSEAMSLKTTGRTWRDVVPLLSDETARRVLESMIGADEIEIRRPLADGSFQTLPNRRLFIERYRKEMIP